MKKHLILCIFLINASIGIAQTLTPEEHSKYWYYRQRLINEFLVIGEEDPITCDLPSGYSMPAHQLLRLPDGSEQFFVGEGPLNLGWYIAVLATESGLLQRYRQPFHKTLQELYYALKTYERLDRKAERLFWPFDRNTGCPTGNYNGLFGRDDVYQGYGALANPAFLARFTENGSLSYTSSLKAQIDNSGALNSYGSPDQTAGMLLGCMMVLKYVPSNVAIEGVQLRNYAVSIARRIGDRLLANDWRGKLENGDVYRNGDVFRDEFVAFGFAKLITKITGDTKYENSLGSVQEAGWYGRASIPTLDITYYNTRHDFAVAYTLLVAGLGAGWSPFVTDEILLRAGLRYGMEIYFLLYEALYDRISNLAFPLRTLKDNLLRKVRYELTIAPPEGPYSYTSGPEQGVTGWRATNRWWRSRRADDGTDGADASNARFNGLDYMLAYNILRLVDPGTNNLSYRYGFILDMNNDITQFGKGYLQSKVYLANHIVNNASTRSGEIRIHSAEEVEMLPGFEVDSGIEVHISTGSFSPEYVYR